MTMSGISPSSSFRVSTLATRLRWHLVLRRAWGWFAQLAFVSGTGASAILLIAGSRSLFTWLSVVLLSLALSLIVVIILDRCAPLTLTDAVLKADDLLRLKDRLTTGLAIETQFPTIEEGAQKALELIRQDLAACGPLHLPKNSPALPLWTPFIPLTLMLLGLLRPLPEEARERVAQPKVLLDRTLTEAVAERLQEMALLLDSAASPTKQSGNKTVSDGTGQTLSDVAQRTREAAETLQTESEAAKALAVLSKIADQTDALKKHSFQQPDPSQDALSQIGESQTPNLESVNPIYPDLDAEFLTANKALPADNTLTDPINISNKQSEPSTGSSRNPTKHDASGVAPGEYSQPDPAKLAQAMREDLEMLKDSIRSGRKPEQGGALQFLIRQQQIAAEITKQKPSFAGDDENDLSATFPSDDPTPGENPEGAETSAQSRMPDAPDVPLRGIQTEQGKTLSSLLEKAPTNEVARRQLLELMAEMQRVEAGAVDRESTPPGERRWIRRYFEMITPR